MPRESCSAATLSWLLLRTAESSPRRRAEYGPDPSKRGAADVSFVAPYVDSLAGMGLFGTCTHSQAETAELDTLPEQVARAAVLMYRLTR